MIKSGPNMFNNKIYSQLTHLYQILWGGMQLVLKSNNFQSLEENPHRTKKQIRFWQISGQYFSDNWLGKNPVKRFRESIT